MKPNRRRPRTIAAIRLPSAREILFVAPALARPGPRLFLTSATILFVELLLIRWIPANITYVGYFTNFVLLGSFLGIGVGILLGRTGHRFRLSPFGPLLLVTVALVYRAQLVVKVSSVDALFFGLSESQRADIDFGALPLVVVLVTLLMASLAMPLGKLLRSLPPLQAYAVDIIGSLFGIAAFVGLSALGTSPVVWFATTGVLLLLLACASGITAWSAVGGTAIACVIGLALAVDIDVWSPYYRITLTPPLTQGERIIGVNGIPHQTVRPMENPFPFYDEIYRWFPARRFEHVLIVGAGAGSDTAVALRHDVGGVDAVEIDPTILRIGVTEHPDQPYADARVRVHLDDGRAFLRRSEERYDLIVFALPDSLTLVTSTANLRLESFLFTAEGFASARDHLAPDGVFVLYNFYRQPWLVRRLEGELATVFGTRPWVRTYEQYSHGAVFLAAGPGLLGSMPPGVSVPDAAALSAAPQVASDDWPFPYLREPGVPSFYLVALGLVLVFGLGAVGVTARAARVPFARFSPHFFVLGAAFLLLETRTLVTFGLLFGTTWAVNALTFFAILTSVLAAIAVNARVRIRRVGLLYLALFASIAVAYALPPESLLIEPRWLRYALASIVAFAPVFLANLVFTYSFRDTPAADMAFASNLLGAMVGGALEYVALVSGYRSLLFIVAGLYLAAYALALRWRLLGDVELAVAAPRHQLESR